MLQPRQEVIDNPISIFLFSIQIKVHIKRWCHYFILKFYAQYPQTMELLHKQRSRMGLSMTSCLSVGISCR